jgi:tetratricopeptide (TPR) repeat protein
MRIFLNRAMDTISPAVSTAAAALQQISETYSGERGRRASAGALVLGVVERAVNGIPACGFLSRRADGDVAALPRGRERALLRQLLEVGERWRALEEPGTLASLLVRYAGELESTQRLPEADAALTLACMAAPGCPEVALHAGRIARKLLDPARALQLYVRARQLDTESGSIGRLAAIGEAVVSGDADAALGRAIRAAVRSGDAEAAGVALEERARIRRASGKRRQAARDLCIAALRFADMTDRARVAHEVADLAVVAGDSLAAREALLLALACGDTPQRDHARGRLHTLSRDVGDEIGMRRWRSFKRPSLVSLSVARAQSASVSAAPRLARWREAVQTAIPATAG